MVVPTRNRCQLLASALKSLVEQEADTVSYEVVVVDNSSEDGTRSVVESFMGKGRPLVRYVREARSGISYARNAGIRAARSSVIAFLDDDCRAGRNWATTIKQTFDSNPNLGCIGGKVLPVWPFQPPKWLDRRHWSPLAITDHGDSTITVDADHPLCLVAANLAIRREVFQHVGLFSCVVARSEDHEFELRFFRAGGQGRYVPTMVVTTDVPAARCTKRYHRRWHARHGRDCATIGLSERIGRRGEVLSQPAVARTLFGVPLFLYRELLAELTAWLGAAGGPASVRFHHEVRVIHLVHYMRQRCVTWSSGHRPIELDDDEHVQTPCCGPLATAAMRRTPQAPSCSNEADDGRYAMPDPRVTIVVVPRERFSASRASLESLYEHTRPGFKLVYVDGGSPPLVKSYLEREASKRSFALVRTERYLSPNRARNLGFASVTTEYVVFIDNDVLVTHGWLDRLIQCADETGAWVVGPLYLMGPIERRFVHMAGGIVTVIEAGGRRVLHEHHRYPHTALDSIPSPLTREPVDLVEFHCMLVQAAALRRLGRLDEQLLSAPEHIDLCMAAGAAGGQVYFEPAAVVSYVPPPPFHRSDLPFFLLRWSDAWNASSLRHFNEKWQVDIQPEYADWLTSHRRTVLEPVHQLVHGLLGWRGGTWVERRVVHPAESLVNDWVVRRYGS